MRVPEFWYLPHAVCYGCLAIASMTESGSLSSNVPSLSWAVPMPQAEPQRHPSVEKARSWKSIPVAVPPSEELRHIVHSDQHKEQNTNTPMGYLWTSISTCQTPQSWGSSSQQRSAEALEVALGHWP